MEQKQDQNETPEKPSEHKFYRELTPRDEELIAGCMEDHPTLTREKCLEMLEYAGY